MDSVLPWLALKRVPGIGNHLFKRLVDHFGSPDAVFSAARDALCAVDGISPRLAGLLKKGRSLDRVRKEADRARENGFSILTMADPGYPPLLLAIPDPPPVLFTAGDLVPQEPRIAMVGSRSGSEYGLSVARRMAGELAGFGVTVVSGMARGIDTAAHEGALAGGGRTVAVLGSGLLNIYPAENRSLFDRITENGAVISEFWLDTGPDARHFPMRNRIISGLSEGCVVVEAAKKSGSLITARLAAEQNRDVLAVPGSVRSAKSAGAHALIRQGAALVESAEHVVLEVYPHLMDRAPAQKGETAPVGDCTPEETEVLRHLSPYPVHVDELAQKAGTDAGSLMALLLQLEIRGVVQKYPGGRYAAPER